MVPAILDPRVLVYLDTNSTHKVFHERIKEIAKNSAYILAGATGAKPKLQEDSTLDLVAERYNSAFLYTPQGKQDVNQYEKIHLVPFGEVIPFKDSFPWIYDFLMTFSPYEYDYSLDPGSEFTVFQMEDLEKEQKTYNFSVMICYEDSIPKIARKFALDESGNKKTDWLLNISNDGWFVKFTDEMVKPSTELAQHNAVCVFRAVENRLAILRSVNTGISCLIDSNGRIKNGFLNGNLPEKPIQRQGMAGWFADQMPIDKRVTLFSRYGSWLDFISRVTLVLVILAVFFSKTKEKAKNK
jgi:apolipoprotein N-acyltransferase